MPKKKIDITDFGVSPFVGALVINVTKNVKHTSDGSATWDSEIEQHTKVFRTIAGRETFAVLSPMGKALFGYIMYNLDSGCDYIKIEPDSFMDDFNVKSPKSFYLASAELKKMAVIAPVIGKRSMFWVNPAIIFCGNRTKKFKDKVVVKYTFNHK